ncbi:N-acetylmuramoyl-L-alanine amidase, partial [Bifidobacteriaceae bacterium NR020]
MRMRKIMGFFLALVMFMGFLSLNPIVSYANDDANNDVEINSTNFPDNNFRDYVKRRYDADGDDKLSKRELEQVTRIELPRRRGGFSSLKGIEYFKKLKTLICYGNHLTHLDVSHNTELTLLDCGTNQLTSLDLSKNPNLTTLDCNQNRLTSL